MKDVMVTSDGRKGKKATRGKEIMRASVDDCEEQAQRRVNISSHVMVMLRGAVSHPVCRLL